MGKIKQIHKDVKILRKYFTIDDIINLRDEYKENSDIYKTLNEVVNIWTELAEMKDFLEDWEELK